VPLLLPCFAFSLGYSAAAMLLVVLTDLWRLRACACTYCCRWPCLAVVLYMALKASLPRLLPLVSQWRWRTTSHAWPWTSSERWAGAG
jgi:hypothetical protein